MSGGPRRALLGLGLGAGVGAALLRVLRALPLVGEEPINDGGGTKKGEKKDFKKKGSGPRTRRKKAKKGK
ncbi:MAG: hypothetical protein H0V95_10770 [Actinobacteria bacterium]|nr:hypothetical protein [Actinomycetota bacterium]